MSAHVKEPQLVKISEALHYGIPHNHIMILAHIIITLLEYMISVPQELATTCRLKLKNSELFKSLKLY